MDAATRDVSGAFRHDDGTPVAFSDAKYEWARAGYVTLVDVARKPDCHITYPAISETLQQSTGISPRQPDTGWVDTPLTLVAEMCVRNGEPQLTALVVTADTLEVGDPFVVAYSIAGQQLPRSLQRAAADMRIACHDHFSRREAMGWDKTKLTGRTGTPRPPTKRGPVKPRVEPAPAKVCTQCHLELLPNGRCGYCD